MRSKIIGGGVAIFVLVLALLTIGRLVSNRAVTVAQAKSVTDPQPTLRLLATRDDEKFISIAVANKNLVVAAEKIDPDLPARSTSSNSYVTYNDSGERLLVQSVPRQEELEIKLGRLAYDSESAKAYGVVTIHVPLPDKDLCAIVKIDPEGAHPAEMVTTYGMDGAYGLDCQGLLLHRQDDRFVGYISGRFDLVPHEQQFTRFFGQRWDFVNQEWGRPWWPNLYGIRGQHASGSAGIALSPDDNTVFFAGYQNLINPPPQPEQQALTIMAIDDPSGEVINAPWNPYYLPDLYTNRAPVLSMAYDLINSAYSRNMVVIGDLAADERQDNQHCVVASLGDTLTPQWQYDCPLPYTSARSIAEDEMGNLYVAGVRWSPGTGDSWPFIIALDAYGNSLWTIEGGNSIKTNEVFTQIVVKPIDGEERDRIFVVGYRTSLDGSQNTGVLYEVTPPPPTTNDTQNQLNSK